MSDTSSGIENRAILTSEEKQDWRLPFSSIALGASNVFELQYAPPPSRHHFEYDNMYVNLYLSSGDNKSTCRMWTEICNMPYTAESPEKRETAFKILRSTRVLQDVKFVIEQDQRILAMYENKLNEDCTLDVLMVEILTFIREAVPIKALLLKKLA